MQQPRLAFKTASCVSKLRKIRGRLKASVATLCDTIARCGVCDARGDVIVMSGINFAAVPGSKGRCCIKQVEPVDSVALENAHLG